MPFYLKLTLEQANALMEEGLEDLFGEDTSAFDQYSSPLQDSQTGDLYWKVKNLQKKGVMYTVEQWVTQAYPQLTHYTWEDVEEFLPG